MNGTLLAGRAARLRERMGVEGVPAFVGSRGVSVAYATGFTSMQKQLHYRHDIAVVITIDDQRLVVPSGDAAAALDAGVSESTVIAYGEFYIEPHFPIASEHRVPTFVDGVRSAVAELGLQSLDAVVEDDGWSTAARSAVDTTIPKRMAVDGSMWINRIRAIKLPEEVDCLRASALAAEKGIAEALTVAREGWSELDVARVIATRMTESGAIPTQLSVQVGDRTALGDAFPTDRRWRRGELLRLDVGCTVEGYWSDIARTAVLGPASAWQQATHAALLAGQLWEMSKARADVLARDLFAGAVAEVRANGLAGYQRTHCGHGIGLDVYDLPRVAAETEMALEPGMVLCLETPYYHRTHGGILIEDEVIITPNGAEPLTTSSRLLHEAPVG